MHSRSSTKAKGAREPFLRLAKREELTPKQASFVRFYAFLLALVAGGLFMLAIGYNPFVIYATFVTGTFKNAMAIQAMIKFWIPMLIASLGVTFAFRMRFWNIGAEGQIIMGAVFASYFALFHDSLPHWLLIAVMLVAGAVGGGLWGSIPAFFKATYNTNETLLTLMLNYIALSVINLLRDGPWQDPSSPGYMRIARFSENAQLDKVLGVQMGWIIALALVAISYVYLNYTKQGYEIRVVGESKETANYSGINVKRVMLRTMFLSGAISGICGMVQATGSDITLANAVAGGVGFTAVIIAVLGRLDPLGVLGVSFLFSVLEKGSSLVQSSYGLSANAAEVLQGVVLFFVLGSELFVRFKFISSRKKGGKAV